MLERVLWTNSDQSSINMLSSVRKYAFPYKVLLDKHIYIYINKLMKRIGNNYKQNVIIRICEKVVWTLGSLLFKTAV